MKAEQLMWAYLLQNGNVVVSDQRYSYTSWKDYWSYYGGCFNNSIKKTEQCLIEIEQYGIDWSKTRGPSDGQESSFNGTFAEEPCYTTVLTGELVLNNGEEYAWGCVFDEPENVFHLVAKLMTLDTIEDIVKGRLETEFVKKVAGPKRSKKKAATKKKKKPL